jgi:hypothetical protein
VQGCPAFAAAAVLAPHMYTATPTHPPMCLQAPPPPMSRRARISWRFTTSPPPPTDRPTNQSIDQPTNERTNQTPRIRTRHSTWADLRRAQDPARDGGRRGGAGPLRGGVRPDHGRRRRHRHWLRERLRRRRGRRGRGRLGGQGEQRVGPQLLLLHGALYVGV